jgi:hypothetical protein
LQQRPRDASRKHKTQDVIEVDSCYVDEVIDSSRDKPIPVLTTTNFVRETPASLRFKRDLKSNEASRNKVTDDLVQEILPELIAQEISNILKSLSRKPQVKKKSLFD